MAVNPVSHTFVQWKGTDVCLDFYCECGYQSHYDGFGAYKVKCPQCSEVWSLPTILPVMRASDIPENTTTSTDDFEGIAQGFTNRGQPVNTVYDGEEDRWLP